MIDTSQARARILERIRSAQKRPKQATATDLAEVAAYLAAHPRGPQQRLLDDPYGQFIAQARRMSSTVEELATSADIPIAVARYLDSHQVTREVVTNPEFAELNWAAAGIAIQVRLIADADLTALTGVFAAVADTGTLAFLSSPTTPASNNLLPENHLVVLFRHQILAAMEDVFDRIRDQLGELPRAVNFVSGPSRTGDIEQTIVLGAHGPYRVHILLIDQ